MNVIVSCLCAELNSGIYSQLNTEEQTDTKSFARNWTEVLTQHHEPADKHPHNTQTTQTVSLSPIVWSAGGGQTGPRESRSSLTRKESEREEGGGGVQTERQTDVMSSSSRPPHTLKQMTRETPRSPAVMDTGTAQYNQSNRYEDKHLNWFLH